MSLNDGNKTMWRSQQITFLIKNEKKQRGIASYSLAIVVKMVFKDLHVVATGIFHIIFIMKINYNDRYRPHSTAVENALTPSDHR